MCGIGGAIFGTQGDGSLVIMEAKKRGEIHLAFAMYILGVLITPASILRTIPVAFIYKSPLFTILM